MKRSKFSLSHQKLISLDMGQLIPIGLIEVLPGDSIQHATSALIRCSPLLAPVMHPVDVRIHHWYVPHRLVWEDWEDFITGGPDGMNASEHPYIEMNPSVGGLADYMGIPTGTNLLGANAPSALPFRGYNLIFNEWYRDQDLVSPLAIDLTSGADTTTTAAIQNIGWEKDYFTSSRPWEQKGPAITIPLGSRADVKGMYVQTGNSIAVAGVTQFGGNPSPANASMSNGAQVWLGSKSAAGTAPATAFNATNANVYADLSSASAITINLLREAFALQRFEEARARYGSRYTEYLRYLGVRSSDARLQRPEYLGGGRNTIQFSEVLSSNGATGGNLGQLGGHGISAMRSNRYRRYFEEHGYVMSLMSVRPKTMYIQGMRRTFSRRVKEDYWQQELQHIGQQEVLNRELYIAHSSPTGTFGFQDRYDEYRREESWVSADFRATLNFWHFARSFASDPALNSTFVTCVPSEVPFAASANDVLWVMVRNNIQARRLVAATGTSYLY